MWQHSINLWLCPQRVIPGLATSYGKGTAHITRLASHLYRIFGLGTVKSHGNDISGLQVEGDVIMCASELITENAPKSISSEKFMAGWGGGGVVEKQPLHFRHKANTIRGDRGHVCLPWQGKAWAVTSDEEHRLSHHSSLGKGSRILRMSGWHLKIQHHDDWSGGQHPKIADRGKKPDDKQSWGGRLALGRRFHYRGMLNVDAGFRGAPGLPDRGGLQACHLGPAPWACPGLPWKAAAQSLTRMPASSDFIVPDRVAVTPYCC